MKNILVTGAAGFIGANFAELMVKKYEGKYNIIVFDKLKMVLNIVALPFGSFESVDSIIGVLIFPPNSSTDELLSNIINYIFSVY